MNQARPRTPLDRRVRLQEEIGREGAVKTAVRDEATGEVARPVVAVLRGLREEDNVVAREVVSGRRIYVEDGRISYRLPTTM